HNDKREGLAPHSRVCYTMSAHDSPRLRARADTERGIVRMSEHERNGDVEFLTVDEVASLLRVHSQTVRRWVRDESIPYVRAGRRGRSRRAAVQEWLAAGRNRAGAKAVSSGACRCPPRPRLRPSLKRLSTRKVAGPCTHATRTAPPRLPDVA